MHAASFLSTRRDSCIANWRLLSWSSSPKNFLEKFYQKRFAVSWFTVSKNAFMSASTTHSCPSSLTSSIRSIACFAFFPARYPKLESENSVSNIGSMTFFSACCTTLSLIVGIPSGRRLPSDFGIYTLFTGLGSFLTNHLNRLLHCSVHFGNQRSVFLLSLLSPITYLNWATISPIDRFHQSRIPSHNRCFILPVVTSRSLAPMSSLLWIHPTSRIASFRLYHPGYTFLTPEPLPYSRTRLRTIRDLPRSPNHPFVFIPTLTRHANSLW